MSQIWSQSLDAVLNGFGRGVGGADGNGLHDGAGVIDGARVTVGTTVGVAIRRGGGGGGRASRRAAGCFLDEARGCPTSRGAVGAARRCATSEQGGSAAQTQDKNEQIGWLCGWLRRQ